MLRRTTYALTALSLLLGACGSGGDDGSPGTTVAEETTTTASLAPLTILVTNDDGITAPGIDAVVGALQRLEAVELVIVAPDGNRSGSSDKTTPGGAAYADAATASGVSGTAVAGFPADAVTVALDVLGVVPHLVVSGINEGQNTGPLAYVSGTVGAARAAARRGIPAVAGSAGLGESADYGSAAALVAAWVEEHRSALAAGTVSTATVTSINIPACTLGGAMKSEVLEVVLATSIPEGTDPFNSDCSAEPATAPGDDVAAVAAGHPARTLVPVEAP